MEITRAGLEDSSTHVLNSSAIARGAVFELRIRFQQESNQDTGCNYPIDAPPFNQTSVFPLLQVSYLLGDLEFTLRSLEEDVREAFDKLDLAKLFGDTTCPIDSVQRWLQSQHRVLDEQVAHLRSVKAEAKRLVERVEGQTW